MAITPYGPSTLPTIITTVSSNSPATTQLNNNTAKVNTLASKVLDSTEFTPAKPRPSRVAIYSHQEVKRASAANEHSQPSTSDITTMSPRFVEPQACEMEPCVEELKAVADDQKKHWVNKIYTELFYEKKGTICTREEQRDLIHGKKATKYTHEEQRDLTNACYSKSPAVCIQALLSSAAMDEPDYSQSKHLLKKPYIHSLNYICSLNSAKESYERALGVIRENSGDLTLPADAHFFATRAIEQINDKIAQYYRSYTNLFSIESMLTAAIEGSLQIKSCEEDELKQLASSGKIEAQYILATWNIRSNDCHVCVLESALADYQMMSFSLISSALDSDLTSKKAKLALRIHQTIPYAEADLEKQKDRMTALVKQLVAPSKTSIWTLPISTSPNPPFANVESKAPLRLPGDETRTLSDVIVKLELDDEATSIKTIAEIVIDYVRNRKLVTLTPQAFQILNRIVLSPPSNIANFYASFLLGIQCENGKHEHLIYYRKESERRIFELCEARKLYGKARASAEKLADESSGIDREMFNHLHSFLEGKVNNLASDIVQDFWESRDLNMAELLDAATSNNPPYLLTEKMQNQLIELATQGDNDARLLAAIYASHGEASLEKLQLIHEFYITLQWPINHLGYTQQTKLLLANKTEEISIRINNPFLDNNVVEDTMASRSSVGLLSNRSRTDDLLSAPVSRAALTTALMPSAAESKSPLVHEHSASATIAEPEAIATMLPAIEEELASVAPTVINMDDLPSTPIPIAVLTTAAPMPSAAESKSPLVNEHSASATIAEPEATVTKLPATEGEPASVAPTVIKVESKENPPKAILSKKEISTRGRSLLSSIAKYSNYTRAIIKFFPQIRAIAEKE